MITGLDFRRLRRWELALAAFALSAPLLLPALAPEGPSFLRPAMAEDMQQPDVSRLVSVGGAITEIIYALGEESRLVGRDSTSTYPEAATKLPDVGYMRQLAPEGIIAVNPTAIVAIEGSGPPEALAVLKEAKIPFTSIPDTFDKNGIVAKIRAVGAFLGVKDKAEALAQSVEKDLDGALAEAAKRRESERKRVLFILSTQGGKILASGTGTAADGIIKLSGAVNAAATFPGYKALTDEAIIEAKPDVVLMMTRGGDHSAGVEELFAMPALSLTPAAKSKALVRMDGLDLLGFGPRTAGAIRELNNAIYGKKTNASQ
ncbi:MULTISPECIES: hemin ABC transporter substrate-binding protein [unclassified Sinorhizobium]|uniref:heme/hemin ABC transporter substrate-binding protein n=1 Tax=unclassified Sinorhizobium TaxID=2613772 RepID=UPI0024C2EE80|nr:MULTISPECIES: hemin ABC transporter substrate-binding protein [unclassified Sinorhizobium]MDK1374806.1 hemin ABC transporter substrate-binding protein [Sinorhizobium sp. 6-70]MDK1478990.1 hemin ABC transporter substrate-binding protein [Sinorhizobium sp. 6-117]